MLGSLAGIAEIAKETFGGTGGGNSGGGGKPLAPRSGATVPAAPAQYYPS